MEWEEIIPWYEEFRQELKVNVLIWQTNLGTDERPMWFIAIHLDSRSMPWMRLGHGKHEDPVEAFVLAGRRALTWQERITKNQRTPEEAKRLGEESEKRLYDLLQSHADELPPWVTFVRRATPEEDAKGADIVIGSDVGDIYLQVKISKLGKNRFKRTLGREVIPVIVIREATPDRHIIVSTIQKMIHFRHLCLNLANENESNLPLEIPLEDPD